MLLAALVVLLILCLAGAPYVPGPGPNWYYGYSPVGLILVVLLILFLLGRI